MSTDSAEMLGWTVQFIDQGSLEWLLAQAPSPQHDQYQWEEDGLAPGYLLVGR